MDNLDLSELKYLSATISDSIQDMVALLDKLLSSNEKSYSINFKGSDFEFFVPTTHEEFRKLKRDRLKLFKLIIKNCIKNVLKTVPLPEKLSDDELAAYEGIWDDVFFFAMGVNPSDLKCERITHEDTYAVGDSQYGKSRPLDIEAYHIDVERPELDVTTFKEKWEAKFKEANVKKDMETNVKED